MALQKARASKGIMNLNEQVRLEQKNLAFSLSAEVLLRGTTKIERTKAQYLHSLEGVRDSSALYFIVLEKHSIEKPIKHFS